ncbi:MAG: HXXEE domain-containing protein [Verrucomicrobiota bacterium]
MRNISYKEKGSKISAKDSRRFAPTQNAEEIVLKWPLFSLAIGLVTLGLGITALQYGSDPDEIILFCFFFLVAGMSFHYVECYIYPGNFIADFNRSYFQSLYEDIPYSPRMALFINFLGLYFASIILTLATYYVSMIGFIPLGMMLAHGIKVLSFALSEKAYTPGCMTSALILIPYPLLASFQLIANGNISRQGFAAGFLLGWAFYTLSLAYLRHRWQAKQKALGKKGPAG